MSDPATEREAIALFEAMLEQPSEGRDDWLEQATVGRTSLAARVRAMIAADADASLRTGGAAEAIEEMPPPERIGAYRITDRIGGGGMGAVWRGERISGFEHAVAIKLIKPGLLSETLIERFGRERQILAGLSHPNIARLYDGGETGAGQPYIVMELIDGEPILNWVAAHASPRGERLRLFGEAISAVAFAHRNLIVHRDLTPSNVLVTRDGAVKLIDFGIARPTDDGEARARPSLGSLSLTPGYAAPERMTSASVTTAADIYSLGKLLDRLIGEPDDRELAAIVAKATADAPEDRYPTAEALGDDVAAWEDGRAVAAIDGGKRYRARKFIARHRVGVAVTAAIAALLIGATSTAIVAETRAEKALAAEATRFNEVRSLARYLLFDLNEQMRRVAGNTRARADLANKAQSYLIILANGSGDREDLKLETAKGLIQLARIQGSPMEPNIGEPERGAANFLAALNLLEALPNTPDVAKAPSRAEARAFRGLILLRDEGRQPDAEKEIALADKTLEAVPLSARAVEWYQARRTVRKAQLELADLGSKFETILPIAAELENDIAKWPQRMRGGNAADIDRASAAYYRALKTSEAGEKTDYGLPQFLAAKTRFDALIADDPNDPVVLYRAAFNLADGFAAASRSGSEVTSNRLIRRASVIIDRLMAIDDRDQMVRKRAGSIKEGLAQNLRDQDKFSEAIALQREVIGLRVKNVGPDRKAKPVADLGFSLMIMGIIARDAGDRAMACDSWRKSETAFGELERRQQLSGSMSAFLPGLRIKKKQCAEGVALNGMKAPIR